MNQTELARRVAALEESLSNERNAHLQLRSELARMTGYYSAPGEIPVTALRLVLNGEQIAHAPWNRHL